MEWPHKATASILCLVQIPALMPSNPQLSSGLLVLQGLAHRGVYVSAALPSLCAGVVRMRVRCSTLRRLCASSMEEGSTPPHTPAAVPGAVVCHARPLLCTVHQHI